MNSKAATSLLALCAFAWACSGENEASPLRDDPSREQSDGGEPDDDGTSEGGDDQQDDGGTPAPVPSPSSPQAHLVWAKDGTSAAIKAALASLPKEGRAVVVIPAGRWTWGNGETVGITRSHLTILGSGAARTSLTRTTEELAPFFTFVKVTDVRVAELTISGNPAPNSASKATGVRLSNVSDFRVDHATFARHGGQGVRVDGTSQGVVDHCRFERIHKAPIGNTFGYGVVVVGTGAIANIPFGSAKATFVEDSTFVACRHAVASNDGARYVFRHNTVTDNVVSHGVDAHGQEFGSKVGTEWVDVHDNSISKPATYSVNAIRIRGGRGLVWNNTISGYQNGLSLLEDTPQQTGPVYIWGNSVKGGRLVTAGAGATYETKAPPSYKPFPYPHAVASSISASAGADVARAATDGGASVTLDGSGSKAAAGPIAAFRWIGPEGPLADTAKATVSLKPGLRTLVLEVEAAGGVVSHDSVVVDIAPTTAP